MAFGSTKLHLGIILVLTFLSYSNIFGNGFLWDDRVLIHGNMNLHEVSKHILFVRDFWAVDPVNTGSPYHRPLVSMLYILDFHIWGEESPFGWHLTNILLLLVASVVVYFLVRELTENGWIAFAAALLFGVHPVHTENITWIAGRTDPLMGIFYFAALWMYVKFSRSDMKKYMYYSLLFFTLSIFSKEVAVTFPVVIVFYDWCKGKTVKDLIARWKIYLPFFAIIPFYAIVRTLALGAGNYIFTKSILRDIVAQGLFDSVMKFLYSMSYYAYLLFWPYTLKARHVMPVEYGIAKTMVVLLVLIITVVLCYKSYKADRFVLFLVGFFIINVLLVSNLFTIRDSFAERFVYIASLSGVIGIPLLFTWLEKHLEIRSLARIAMVILICSFMITTLHRNTFWESPLTLFQQEVKVNPMSSEAYFLLGNAYQGIGNNTMAVANYQKAISLNPNEFEAHMHLVNQYLGIGDIVTAHLHAKEMFRINSGDHKAPFYMGHTLALMKKYEEAEYYLRAAVLMKPQHGLYQQAYSEVRFLQNKTNAPVPTQ